MKVFPRGLLGFVALGLVVAGAFVFLGDSSEAEQRTVLEQTRDKLLVDPREAFVGLENGSDPTEMMEVLNEYLTVLQGVEMSSADLVVFMKAMEIYAECMDAAGYAEVNPAVVADTADEKLRETDRVCTKETEKAGSMEDYEKERNERIDQFIREHPEAFGLSPSEVAK